MSDPNRPGWWRFWNPPASTPRDPRPHRPRARVGFRRVWGPDGTPIWEFHFTPASDRADIVDLTLHHWQLWESELLEESLPTELPEQTDPAVPDRQAQPETQASPEPDAPADLGWDAGKAGEDLPAGPGLRESSGSEQNPLPRAEPRPQHSDTGSSGYPNGASSISIAGVRITLPVHRGVTDPGRAQ